MVTERAHPDVFAAKGLREVPMVSSAPWRAPGTDPPQEPELEPRQPAEHLPAPTLTKGCPIWGRRLGNVGSFWRY